MTKVLVLGATGTIAQHAVKFMHANGTDVIQFVRTPSKLRQSLNVIQGDAADVVALKEAMTGVDVVYANLGPTNMPVFAQAVMDAMHATGVTRLIWTATAGVHDELPVSHQANAAKMLGTTDDPTSYMGDQAAAVKLIMASDLDYTIIRPNWLTNDDQVQAVIIAQFGTELPDGAISRKTVGHFVSDLVNNLTQHQRGSISLSGK
ncbi:NAD(P)H-binding protein [Periweissella cryptocerci]|nr:NAD(P)H-binding protein [Periweissella cryptocerci]